MLADFGPAFSGITQLLALSNLDFVSFLPLDCVVSMNHHGRLLMYTLGILSLDAVLMLAFKAGGQKKLLTALFLVNSFLLPQVSMTIFSTFSCTEFDGDYGRYLTADKSIDCESGAHSGMVACVREAPLPLNSSATPLTHGRSRRYATAMIVVFPVGKPLLCLYLLWRKRGEIDVGQDRLEKEHAGLHGDGATGLKEAVELRDKNEDIKHLAFLYESYQPKYWWYVRAKRAQREALTLLRFASEASAKRGSVSAPSYLGPLARSRCCVSAVAAAAAGNSPLSNPSFALASLAQV
jgi:hypothetical protein